jgi:hypothetical protein
MTQLADLTLSQIAAAYGALSGVETGPKTFNSKAKAISRLDALLTERGLAVADALHAAGIAPDAAVAGTDDGDGCEVEQTGRYGEDDIPGTEDPPEPGMVWDSDAWVQPEPMPAETDDRPATAPDDAEMEAVVTALEAKFTTDAAVAGIHDVPPVVSLDFTARQRGSGCTKTRCGEKK